MPGHVTPGLTRGRHDTSAGPTPHQDQLSAVNPICLTIGAHLIVSLASSAENSCGVLDIASSPKVARPSTTSFDASAVLSAPFKRATRSAGAFGGSQKPNHSLCCSSPKPCSV